MFDKLWKALRKAQNEHLFGYDIDAKFGSEHEDEPLHKLRVVAVRKKMHVPAYGLDYFPVDKDEGDSIVLHFENGDIRWFGSDEEFTTAVVLNMRDYSMVTIYDCETGEETGRVSDAGTSQA